MRVLIPGSGGREHALARACLGSLLCPEVFVSPGNPGMELETEKIRCVSTESGKYTPADYRDLAQELEVDLVIPGPEALIVDGIRETFDAVGIKCFAPTSMAARLESSKSFAKKVMALANVPTAPYEVFTDIGEALGYAYTHFQISEEPIVIKADGLCAGKGVVVAKAWEEALEAVFNCLEAKIFGSEGETILIENFLSGVEASYFALVGKNGLVAPFGTAKDNKRLLDGDEGPNTGGVGAESPNPYMTPEMELFVLTKIVIPTVRTMAELLDPFEGFLYVGLMLTANGPYVVEFNIRFGDPEAQVVLLRLETDFVQHLLDTLEGTLDPNNVLWVTHRTVCVVLCSQGYPAKPEVGFPITGLEEAANSAFLFFSGVKKEDDDLITSGGRVLGVVGMGKHGKEREIAYDAVKEIHFEGMHYRKDI